MLCLHAFTANSPPSQCTNGIFASYSVRTFFSEGVCQHHYKESAHRRLTPCSLASGLLSCQLPTLALGGATGYCPVCSREVGLTGTQIGLAVANGGLGQEVCEFLQGRLLVAGSGPQLWGQEPIGCLEGVEGCLHDAQMFAQMAVKHRRGARRRQASETQGNCCLKGRGAQNALRSPTATTWCLKDCKLHHAALQSLSLTCCASIERTCW